MILSKCLLNSDQTEDFREWAKEKEPPVDFNKTISDEVDSGTIEAKRYFMSRFLVRKQMELSEILASRRTRNYARKEGGGSAKFVKFREKTFQVVECNEEDKVTGEILDENKFLSAMKKKHLVEINVYAQLNVEKNI